MNDTHRIDRERRRLIIAGCGSVLLAPLISARAEEADPLPALIAKASGGAQVQAGRVHLEIPRIADNGNAVPLKVSVESPMSAESYVKTIHILSEKNPRPVIAVFHLGARSGRAQVNTRIRLNGTQRVVALAELSDGSYWSDTVEVDVTESACYDATNP